jgi:YaiO family outer membrane protein
MVFSLLLAAALAVAPPVAQTSPAAAELTHAEAQQAAEQGRYAEALVAFQRLAAKNPADHEARLWIARLHERMGHPSLAEPVYRSVHLEDPRRVEAMTGVARTLIARDEPQLAIDMLEPALAIEPDNDQIHALLGDAHRQAGRNAIAIMEFERATSLQRQHRPNLESTRIAHFHRLDLRGLGEQFDDGTPNGRSGDLALQIRLGDKVRALGRGQIQRRFGTSEHRGGAGLHWQWKPTTALRGQALFGPDNVIMPTGDIVGEVEHTYDGVTWAGMVRYLDFSTTSAVILSPGVSWMPTPRTAMMLRYALAFTDAGADAGATVGQTVHVRPAYRLVSRLWIEGGYAFGVEDFENYTIDRTGDFRAHTWSGGLRLNLPSLTTVAAGYEQQWRRDSVTVQRAVLSISQSF